jgi:hypothetical protein
VECLRLVSPFWLYRRWDLHGEETTDQVVTEGLSSRLPVTSECTVKDAVLNEVKQVGVYLVSGGTQAIRDAHEVFNDRNDFVEGEANWPVRRGRHSRMNR